MKRKTHFRIVLIIFAVITITVHAQVSYLGAVTKNIYISKQNTAEQALLLACQYDGVESCKPECVDSAFVSYLKKWTSFAPYHMSFKDADGNEIFVSGDKDMNLSSKCHHIRIPWEHGRFQSVEVDYDYKAAFIKNSNSLMNITMVFNFIILLMVIFLTVFLKKRHMLASAKDSFMNIVAHNLRNPIAVAQAAAEAMSVSDAVKDDMACKSMVEINLRQLDILNSEVESVLRKTRTGKRYSKEDYREISLLPFIEKILSSTALSHQDAVFSMDIDPSHVMEAVPEQLASIISVLVDNSIKYSTGTPEITIYSRKDKKGKISLSVRDHGIGFSKKEKKRAFDEYYRGKRGRLFDTSGFGLGLHYVKQTAKENHWKITLNSSEGAGATITISE